jgi:hypothetical protein
MIERRLERRQKRSQDPQIALQFLLEALADRSDAHAVALVAGDGRIVAGVGMPSDLRGLATIAAPVARGEDCPDLDAVTGDSDVFSRVVPLNGSDAYIAALGTRLRRLGDTVDGFARITAS